ncbi:hypothetical protein [Mesorhizobium sp. M0491]|uniref:hypothetical protein n=1 Tax=Mesorhizobium sp. M0491 TaxID=2956950 RepID=UPI0033381AAA
MPKVKRESFIESERADQFAATLEEATRSTEEGVKYFIEPAKGTLSRGKTRRHHFIFGRRGSGKSSLLNKLRAELTLDRMPVAYIDLETFKGHSYPDVLISIIIKTLDSYSEWFSTAGVYPASKQSFWKKLFGAKPREKSIDSRKVDGLLKRVTQMRAELAHLLTEPEEVSRVRKSKQTKERNANGKGSIELPQLHLEGGVSRSSGTEREISDNYSSKKIETLHRRIIDFKQLFADLSSVSGKQSYLFLDDLYHIRSDHQAEVVDYFHRITKGTNTWLKIGTIKHRTQWYFFGQPPIGMKLGDDADEIDLDVTLEKYDLTKEFLIKVLDQFCREHDSKVADSI